MAKKYPVSDHCDGLRFFNSDERVEHGFWAAMTMLFKLKLKQWPKWVANDSVLDLHQQLSADSIAITFVNHATVLIQTQTANILTDPVWCKRASPLSWVGPKRHREPGIPFEQLPKIDVVLISHNHYDHLDICTLKRLNKKCQPCFFVPLGNKKFLLSQGILNVVELDWWQTTELSAEFSVSLAPAKHFSSRSLFDKNKTLWGSYVVSSNKHLIYFAGDTAYSTHFKTIYDYYGIPDIAFLPIGAYEPREFMKSVHMNPEEAVEAHLDLSARQSIGIHFGTFQLTEERIEQPVIDLQLALKNKSVLPAEFIVLKEGKTQIFNMNEHLL